MALGTFTVIFNPCRHFREQSRRYQWAVPCPLSVTEGSCEPVICLDACRLVLIISPGRRSLPGDSGIVRHQLSMLFRDPSEFLPEYVQIYERGCILRFLPASCGLSEPECVRLPGKEDDIDVLARWGCDDAAAPTLRVVLCVRCRHRVAASFGIAGGEDCMRHGSSCGASIPY